MFGMEMRKKPQFETERLVLSRWKLEDAQSLFDYAKDENVGPHAGWRPHKSVNESKEIIKTIFLPNMVWKIVLKETGEVIGSIGLEPDRRREGIKSKEMGYSLAYNHWGKGYMTEAAKCIKDYAFDVLSLELLAIQTGPDNIRSQRVIDKLGFIYEGRLRKAYKIYDGSNRDVLVYSITREEWCL
ncbi:MAG: GNAT family protein [Anaerovoracaceae bacterium]